jgi:uncharacterized membrane protein
MLVIATFAASFLYYPYLPEEIPVHWNMMGEIDGYMSKPLGAFIMPLMAMVVFILYRSLPQLDPKKSNYKHFENEWHLIQVAIVGFFAYMQFLIFFVATRPETPFLPLMFFGLGGLFILVGYSMTKLKQNFFVGIRVPWTLASEENWKKTHRFAKIAYMMAGGLLILNSFFSWFSSSSIFFAVILMAISPAIYSLLVYKKIIA